MKTLLNLFYYYATIATYLHDKSLSVRTLNVASILFIAGMLVVFTALWVVRKMLM